MSFAHLSANEAQLPVKPIGFDRGCFLTDKSREVCARVQLFKGIIPEGENYATILCVCRCVLYNKGSGFIFSDGEQLLCCKTSTEESH